MRTLKHYLSKGIEFILSLLLFFMIIAAIGLFYLELKLPAIETLDNIQYQVPLRIYSANKKLIAEYGEKRRIPIKIDQVPKTLIYGLLATEDQRFFEHPGVDLFGLARAAVQLIKTGSKTQGGSTITMQVARNFFLERKKTYLRKLNEILLAIKIDHYFPKEKILELYLNKIYLGNRAYGVAAAAQTYYGKELSELTLAEIAMISGLPQAPSAINPITNPIAAKARRNHVLARMLEESYITEEDYQKAIRSPIVAHYHGQIIELKAPYVAEFVRQQLTERLGKQSYTSGYKVYTTISEEAQISANQAVRDELIAYDQRHGYRGPIEIIPSPESIKPETLIRKLEELQKNYPEATVAYVAQVTSKRAQLILSNKQSAEMLWQNLRWAAKPQQSQVDNVLSIGQMILISHSKQGWNLYQIPEVEGALIALSPQNGAIQSMVGGFSFHKSHFNRAIQAERQPGSCFKPFIYSAALDQGYTLATLINDAPIVQNDPSLESTWRPQNDNHKFSGLTRLRYGLVRSRNLVSIRLLDAVGIPKTIDYLKQFGFNTEKFPQSLSLALGSISLTPLELARAYSSFANGGSLIEPYLIERIEDVNQKTIFEAKPKTTEHDDPNFKATQVIDDRVAYLINHALQDVIQHGTARALKTLERRDLAGKTGTTNDHVDAWFAGYIPNQLVAIAWIGFDQPESLHEYAARTALPMWKKFIKPLLSLYPEEKITMPNGIVTVKINPETGQQADPDSTESVFEYFREENVPPRAAMNKEKQNKESHHLF